MADILHFTDNFTCKFLYSQHLCANRKFNYKILVLKMLRIMKHLVLYSQLCLYFLDDCTSTVKPTRTKYTESTLPR